MDPQGDSRCYAAEQRVVTLELECRTAEEATNRKAANLRQATEALRDAQNEAVEKEEPTCRIINA